MSSNHSGKSSYFFSLIIISLAISLNQSSILFGTNISLADFFCISTLLLLANKDRLLFPFAPTIFFVFLSALLLLSSLFYVPYKLFYYPEASTVTINYAKLILAFMYFIIGFNIKEEKLIIQVVKWYSISSVLIGVLGCLFITFNFKLSESMFLDFRFKGLMNDPNYFSIIQVSALVFFSRNKAIKLIYRNFSLLILFISILASGSKTGILTLFIYIIFRTIEALFNLRVFPTSIFFRTIALSTIVIAFLSISSYIDNFFYLITSEIPSLSRIQYIFTDFGAAMSENGSGRNLTWSVGMEMIKLSPILGVGIGTYTGVSQQLFGTDSIAHNTYLQLFAEWGIFLALLLFVYIFFGIIKVTFINKYHTETNYILRDILVIFCIGSFAISLNNARMMWFFLGIIVYYISVKTNRKNWLMRKTNFTVEKKKEYL